MLLWFALLMLAALTLAAGEPRRFDGHRVYHVLPSSGPQVHFLKQFAAKYHRDVVLWKDTKAANRTADVMVSPQLQNTFLQALADQAMESSVYIEDVQMLIDNERPAKKSSASFDWDDYHTLDEIYAWLDSLPDEYPGLVTSVVAGSSYEGREIKGVKISFGAGNPNRTVVIEGGMHSMEWISPASVTWFIRELLTANETRVRSIIELFDFYVFPVCNPDGYIYTWTDDRMWRKNRKPYGKCVGADLNRNWDFHWAEVGDDDDACLDTYYGPEPFSEVETRSLSEFLAGLGDGLQLYLSFHSWAQLILYPFAAPDVVASNNDLLRQMAWHATKALGTKYGTYYMGGSVRNFYDASGISTDWVRGALGAPYAFTWELRDHGQHGYLLPADQIVPTGEETFDSIVCILRVYLTADRNQKQLR